MEPNAETVDPHVAIQRLLELCQAHAAHVAGSGLAKLYASAIVARERATAGLSHKLVVGLHVADSPQWAEYAAVAGFATQRGAGETILKTCVVALPRDYPSERCHPAFADTGLHAAAVLEPAIESDGRILPGVYGQDDRLFAMWITSVDQVKRDAISLGFRLQRARSIKEAADAAQGFVLSQHSGHEIYCADGREVPLRLRAPSRGPNGGRLSELKSVVREATTGLITRVSVETTL